MYIYTNYVFLNAQLSSSCRRKLINQERGSHYVSVVSTIGNESRFREKLYSRPGYLQIFHDLKPVNCEVPDNSVNTVPSTRADPASLEYLAGSEKTADKDIIVTKSEPIQLLFVKKELVKPYAVVDMTDIATKAGLDDTETKDDTATKAGLDDTETKGDTATKAGLDDTATKHKSKHHKNKHVPSNREALSHSFGSCTDNNNVTQVELNTFYTIPLYVNLHVPMTINPSYITVQ